MSRRLAIAFVVLCTVTMLAACATHEPAPGTSQSAAKKKQQQGVGVGAEGVGQAGRSDPGGTSTGAGLEVGQDPLNEPGRTDNQ